MKHQSRCGTGKSDVQLKISFGDCRRSLDPAANVSEKTQPSTEFRDLRVFPDHA
jgi:hypothetical protein